MFILLLSRVATLNRIQYYRADGRSLPDTTECARMAIREVLSHPDSDAAVILPLTPERLVIDAVLISSCMVDFKRQLLRR